MPKCGECGQRIAGPGGDSPGAFCIACAAHLCVVCCDQHRHPLRRRGGAEAAPEGGAAAFIPALGLPSPKKKLPTLWPRVSAAPGAWCSTCGRSEDIEEGE